MNHQDESKESMTDDDTCVECSAKIGQIHNKWCCDIEICPFCGGQLMTCDCVNNLMDIVLNRTDADTIDCFTQAEKERWLELIGDLKVQWQEVLDSPYQTYDMYFDLLRWTPLVGQDSGLAKWESCHSYRVCYS